MPTYILDVQRSFSQGLIQRITIQPRQGRRVLSHCIYSVVLNGPQQSSSSLVYTFFRPVELIRIQQKSILSRSWSAYDVLDAGKRTTILSPASALSPSMIQILTDYVNYATASCRRLIEHNDSGRLLSAMPLSRDSRLLFLSDSTHAARSWDHVLPWQIGRLGSKCLVQLTLRYHSVICQVPSTPSRACASRSRRSLTTCLLPAKPLSSPGISSH